MFENLNIELVKNLYIIYFSHPIRFHVTHPHQFILFQNQLLKNKLSQSVGSVELGIKVLSGRTKFKNPNNTKIGKQTGKPGINRRENQRFNRFLKLDHNLLIFYEETKKDKE